MEVPESPGDISLDILLLGCTGTGKRNLADALIERKIQNGISFRIHVKSTIRELKNIFVNSDFVVFIVQMSSQLSFDYFRYCLNRLPKTFPARKVCIVTTEFFLNEISTNVNGVADAIQNNAYHKLNGQTNKDANAVNILADQLWRLILSETGVNRRGTM